MTNAEKWKAWSEIRQLVDRYSHGVTTMDLAMVQACFGNSSTWEITGPFSVTAQGSEIATLIIGFLSECESAFQSVGSVVIDVVDSDHAIGRVAIQEAIIGHRGAVMKSEGIYSDEYCRIGGTWLFQSRCFRALRSPKNEESH